MASRLDKLYELLESNNASVRAAAAVQIGQISSNCPLQLHSLLNKLLPYIKHKNWSVRISASETLKHIGRNTKLWVPNGRKLIIYEEMSPLISLEKLNLLEILKIGTRLYSTDIKELEGSEMDPSINKAEINKLLGVLVPSNDSTEIGGVDNEDFGVFVSLTEENKVSVADAVESCQGRRVRKRSHSACGDVTEEFDDPNGPCRSKVLCPTIPVSSHITTSPSSIDEQLPWPWINLCHQLLLCLWHHKWEVRHGAATALRELTRSQGSVMIHYDHRDVSRSQFDQCHILFLEDVIARLLCTLALDQLSDFVNDEMVAPVRESCAQCLGLLTVYLPDSAVLTVTRHLLTLLDHCEWTVTHGALLGLKYLLASRLDSLPALLSLVYDPICTHLRDSRDDDVRCAAAAALMPLFASTDSTSTTSWTLSHRHRLESLRADLWTVLSLRADYTSPGATSAVLHLLERLYEDQSVVEPRSLPPQREMSSCVNRLHWCYYNYGHSVRIAALGTCAALVRYYGSSLGDLVPDTLLQVLTQLYQRVLIDDSVSVVKEAERLWHVIIGEVSAEKLAVCCADKLDLWLCYAMQPARLGYNMESLLLPYRDEVEDEHTDIREHDCKHLLPMEAFIGGRESHLVAGSSSARSEAVLTARLAACRCLASLCRRLSRIPTLDTHIISSLFTQVHLKERLALQRFVAATVLSNWPYDDAWVADRSSLVSALRQQLMTALEEPIYYQELLPQFREMVKSCRGLAMLYEEHGVMWRGGGGDTVARICSGTNQTTRTSPGTATLNLAQCQSLVSEDIFTRLLILNPSSSTQTLLSCARTSVQVCANEHGQLTRLVEVALARAMLSWHWLPPRLTPLIRPLMDTVRTETRRLLQREAAIGLGQLMVDCVSSVHPMTSAAMGKLLKNVVTSLSEGIDQVSKRSTTESLHGLVVLDKLAELGGTHLWPGQESTTMSDDGCGGDNTECDGTEGGAARVRMRGARMALEEVCLRLTLSIITTQTLAATIMLELLCRQPMRDLPLNKDTGITLASLRAMDTCLPIMGSHWPPWSISSLIMDYTQCLIDFGLCHEDMTMRHWSGRVLAILAMPQTPGYVDTTIPRDTSTPAHTDTQGHKDTSTQLSSRLLDSIIFNTVLPCLDASTNDLASQGAIEMLLLLFHRGQLAYRLSLVVLVLPTVLRSLNSHLDTVRRTATILFSLLLTLLPLEQHGADMSLLSPSRQLQRQSSRHFIDGLLNPDSIVSYDVSHCIRSSLRHYQQLGVNWLSFLHKYGLHGVLADDMGLGKTLQTLSIIAGECSRDPDSCQPSLVVCPSTLTAHWLQEINNHVSSPNFSAIVYSGPPDTRHSLVASFHRHQVVITSYDILRHDMDRLQRPSSSSSWLYLVLDEGHLIRNHKSKLSQAVKSVLARHRLVLTGTPIQNRVAELWSLFDFLMPGLLGPHCDFQRRYGKPLCHANSVSGKRVDSEAGTLALTSLHKQVLPFMLRRVKEDVLHELPPKIIQDYVCIMSSLQQRLYSLFISSEASGSGIADMGTQVSLDQRRHAFQAMHYLRMVVNHPSLVLTADHPLYKSITQELAVNNQCLDDSHLSGKMTALRQLILDCGLGTDDCTSDDSLLGSSGLVSSHRLLLFCQSRAMIGLVEKMLTRHLPRVSYLRMDGSVAIRDRQSIIAKFNDDPSVDMLLLTTGVGGLGLNLTSADTVIFVEHDWNPMRDLQAMDRAHRIGQQRTVNVYRLITMDSIEEKIMNLQQFKSYIASTVLSHDNKDMMSMDTHTILDLMSKKEDNVGGDKKKRKEDERHVYDTIDEYGEEYDLDNYVKML